VCGGLSKYNDNYGDSGFARMTAGERQPAGAAGGEEAGRHGRERWLQRTAGRDARKARLDETA